MIPLVQAEIFPHSSPWFSKDMSRIETRKSGNNMIIIGPKTNIPNIMINVLAIEPGKYVVRKLYYRGLRFLLLPLYHNLKRV